ncbi:MAG: VOC family protein [Rubrivivax sp.]|nr:VOC family protein [Pyrinomonadaceae bacterium]
MESKTVNTLKAHLALNVKDVEKSIEFYRLMLGLEPSKVRTGYAKFDVQTPPLNLTLNENSFNERGALSHLGIQVGSTEDVLAMRERWHAAGLRTFDEMGTSCCYALQDKTWVADPDGNEWEAFVVLEDNLPETSPCECGEKTTEAQTPIEAQASASCCAGDATAAGVAQVSAPVATETSAAETSPDISQFADCGPADCCAPTAVKITR